MKKNFYCFPFKKAVPYILYNNAEVFNSPIFASLYNKIAGRNSWRMVLRKNKLLSFLFENALNKSEEVIPDQNVRLIYKGYDRSIYFCLDKNLHVNCVFSGSDNHFVKEEYLGETLNIFDPTEFKSVLPHLIKFFREQWTKLACNEISIHGDLTPFNICIDGNKVTLIDQKSEYSDSIIFDRVYFFAYSMDKLKYRHFLSDKKKKESISLIQTFVKSSIPEDDHKKAATLASEIILKSQPPVQNFEEYRKEFVELLKTQ